MKGWIMKIKKINKYGVEPTWDIEVEDVHEFVLDNGCVSHNTSGSTIRSTEGIEPVRKLVTVKTGNYSCKQLVPNLNKLRSGYEIAWDINPEKLIKTASVRQRWICQSQSFSTYNKDRHESAFEILKDVILAEKYGLKSLYYAHTPKDDEEEEVCESCSA